MLKEGVFSKRGILRAARLCNCCVILRSKIMEKSTRFHENKRGLGEVGKYFVECDRGAVY